jgi:hypothetical protein
MLKWRNIPQWRNVSSQFSEKSRNSVVRFEGLMAVKMLMFGETCYLQPCRWRLYVSSKSWYVPTCPHGVTQKANIDVKIKLLV